MAAVHPSELKTAEASRPTTPSSEDKVPSLNNTDNDTIVEDGKSQVEIEPRSKGVIEMEALRERINVKYLVLLYGTFALLAYVLSLNQYTSSDILDVALSVSFEMHSLRATIGTVTAVFQAVSQPPIAKFADAFGRVNAYLGCVFLYVLGYIIVPASTNIYMYAAGNSIYILGITGLFLLQNIIISDISSLRSRYFWTIFPSIPGAINVWVSGNITSSLLGEGKSLTQWRWGFAMFTILTPILAIPIIVVLWRGTRPSRIQRAEIRQMKQTQKTIKTRALETFWQLDGPGIFLCVAGFGMFFITITLANGPTSDWSDAHCIALLVVGAATIVGFGVYEKMFAPHPMIPFHLLKKKDVIGCLLIALFHPMSGRIVNGYFYTFLIVARDETYLSAGRLTSIPSFAATVFAIIASVGTRYWRRLKPVLIFGFAIQTLAYGLMIRFRQSTNSQAEVVIVQILKGFGIGLISFPAQAVIQSATAHEHLAAVTATYLIIFYLTSGIGTAIGGAIWTNIVPNKIEQYFAPFNNGTLNDNAYGDPFTFATTWPVGTPERAALARAQDEAQRIIVIVGTCVCFLGLLVSIFLISNVRLPDTQSLEENELEAEKLAQEKAAKNQNVVTKL